MVDFKLIIFMILSFCNVLALGGMDQVKLKPQNLNAEIFLTQEKKVFEAPNEFQPLFPVTISLVLKNNGTQDSKPMKIFVRYAYPQPHQHADHSVIFETEKFELPPVQPSAEQQIQFKKTHSLPTIADFVLDKWPTRQYQAVSITDSQEEIIGTLALTYSAYYYPIKARD